MPCSNVITPHTSLWSNLPPASTSHYPTTRKMGLLDPAPSDGRGTFRVVDIMFEELGWGYGERKKQTSDAVAFLKSMSLYPGYLAHIPDPEPRGYLEKAERAL
ncbi:hypothetical protein BDQ17DRAFT_1432241 [Cyathus striatus]|nr:hypothetical protein BDQ17DRAFT_1432241 [Cyathus striatus]